MKRAVLAVLLGVLIWLLAARMGLEQQAAPAAAMDTWWDPQRYNVLDPERSGLSGTAGSALLAEADSYFLSRSPTAKHDLTGSLTGKDLILILAENWAPETLDPAGTPALYRLWSNGAHFTEMYAPDWYQGADGREFALLSGMTPTTVSGETAMAWTAQQSIRLPYSLAAGLAGAGYTCRAWTADAGREAAYRALGFAGTEAVSQTDMESKLRELAKSGPFFVYWVLEAEDGEPALAQLWQAMDQAGLTQDMAVCLLTGHTDPLRGHLFLWGPGLDGRTVSLPCSELDVTATLLDLFGAAYDARFLSGRDLFAPAQSGPPALVALYGSAYAGWVSEAGFYSAEAQAFFPTDVSSGGQPLPDGYIGQMCREVYDRYAYARQVLESNYFQRIPQ